MSLIKNIKLVGISYHFPKKKIKLVELEKKYPNWQIKKIIKKTGIHKVFHSSLDETALSLAIEACKKLFKQNKINKKKIQSLIFVTQSAEYNLPTTACILQDKLNINRNIFAYDINLGCSGFVSALITAASLINSNIVSNSLIVCSDTYSKYISNDDRTNFPIFSDAASACFIKKGGNLKIGPYKYGTDGSGADNLIVKSSGIRGIISKKQPAKLFMNGPQILLFTLNEIPKAIEEFLNENLIEKKEIDFFIFHQANKYVIDNLIQKLKIEKSKAIFSAKNQGNTVSSTIPIALKDLEKKEKNLNRKKILIVGFGVGYSWSITLLENK
mgnify:CR=1 FL=1